MKGLAGVPVRHQPTCPPIMHPAPALTAHDQGVHQPERHTLPRRRRYLEVGGRGAEKSASRSRQAVCIHVFWGCSFDERGRWGGITQD